VDDEPLEQFERVDPANGPEEAVERLIERDLVLSVLSGLPESHRTALVLRELEGRSHQEIAETMGMSPSQAKALIHRAKGSFRRRWLVAVTEKGGLAGIAVLPLVWLLQATHIAKRVVDRVAHVGQVAQAASPEVVSSVASSPAVVATGAGFGERALAAGMTLLVAGGVTVGAATIVRDRGDRVNRAEAPSVEPAAPAPPVDRAEEVVPRQEQAISRKERVDRVKPVVVEPSPVVPTPSPTAPPSVSPTPTPTPTPSPPPVPTPPPIPPAPAWSFAFDSSVDLGTGSFEQISSRVSGRAGQELLFSQGAAALRHDADGNQIGRVYLEYWGAAKGAFGSVDLWLFIDTPGGRFRFDGTGILAAAAGPAEGGFTYVFSGTYSLVEQPPLPGDGVVPELPLHDGTFQLELGFWADGKSLYSASLDLIEV
jgi:hypothetical protein